METTTYKDHDLYFENHVTLFGGSGKKTYLQAQYIDLLLVHARKIEPYRLHLTLLLPRL